MNSATRLSLSRDAFHRRRLENAKTLRIPDLERAQAREQSLLLDTFGHHAHAKRLGHAHHGLELGLRSLAGAELADHAAVDLHESGPQRLERCKRHRAPAEAIDQHATAI